MQSINQRGLLPPKTRRMPRLVRAGHRASYHVTSRICGQAFLLDDVQKEHFRSLLRRVAGFCGVEVLTYAILENHFHLLIEVPGTPGELSDEELLARARLLYGDERKGQPLSILKIELALRADAETRLAMRGILLRRMASLPMFVKMLKQRFSLLYNRQHGRVGTLWEDRFHSVLVENTPAALRAVAAYIDLNPVRAGLVRDPKDYRFSGYGEAAGNGRGWANYPLFRHLAKGHVESIQTIAALYRRYLYLSAADPRKGAFLSAEAIAAVLAKGGEVPPSQLLRCRLRYMATGAAIGTRAFLEKHLAQHPRLLRRLSAPSVALLMEEAP
ncbi:MAG: transposase [Opitutales bacterium]|nr:transposase [Opitutales bacterium]